MSGNNLSITELNEKESTVLLSMNHLNTSNGISVFYQVQLLLNRGFKNFILDLSKIKRLAAGDLGGLNYLLGEAYASGLHIIMIMNGQENKKLFKILEFEKNADITETYQGALHLLNIRRKNV